MKVNIPSEVRSGKLTGLLDLPKGSGFQSIFCPGRRSLNISTQLIAAYIMPELSFG